MALRAVLPVSRLSNAAVPSLCPKLPAAASVISTTPSTLPYIAGKRDCYSGTGYSNNANNNNNNQHGRRSCLLYGLGAGFGIAVASAVGSVFMPSNRLLAEEDKNQEIIDKENRYASDSTPFAFSSNCIKICPNNPASIDGQVKLGQRFKSRAFFKRLVVKFSDTRT